MIKKPICNRIDAKKLNRMISSNFEIIEQPGIIINETITSRDDTDRLSEIFLLEKQF